MSKETKTQATTEVKSSETIWQLTRERLEMARIHMKNEDLKEYIDRPDVIELAEGQEIPVGYKKCGHCHQIMKFTLFNKNKATKTGCTGTCKACQKLSASKSYKKCKDKRNHKKYYEEHKEAKREQSRRYYEKNKEALNKRHQEYLQTKKGRSVMQKAHAKRRAAIRENQGVPYTREMILRRDTEFIGREQPICYLCGQPITNTTGTHAHLDHIVSLNNGGKDCFTNVVHVHATCNLKKEKDDRNLTADAVTIIKERSEAYIEAHPEEFE